MTEHPFIQPSVIAVSEHRAVSPEAAVPTETAASPQLPENLGFLVNKVAEKINRQVELITTPHGLNVRQYGLLVLLQTDGPQAQIVLSQQVGLDRTTVMRTVDLLENRGLVRRDPDLADRRKHSVALTDAGTDLLTQTLNNVRQSENEVTGMLSAEEEVQLMGLLRRILLGELR